MYVWCTARRRTRRRPPHRLRDPLYPDPVRQLEGEDSATLVRGTDRYGYFEPEPRPQSEFDPALIDFHREMTERNARILYRGTGIETFDDARALRG